MTTSGGREIRQNRRVTLITALGAAAVTAALALGLSQPSQALTSPPADKAEIIYSNGGRILTMNADGTDRVVLFGEKRRPANDRMGAMDPEVSPNGHTIVFNFRRGEPNDPVNDVWRMNADGTGANRLFKSTKANRYVDPSFTPGGRVLLTHVHMARRVVTKSLISVRRNGGDRKVLMSDRQRNRRSDAQGVPVEATMSPDGRRVLYLSVYMFEGGSYDEFFGGRLGVLTLKTGKTDWIDSEAYGADWSPDGKKVVFSALVYKDGSEDVYSDVCWWELGCEKAAKLVIADPDGKNRRSLTSVRFDARNPDWAEGGRIVFQANRTAGETGEQHEIHSVLASGKCLTALTNGSPSSLTPVWNSPGSSGNEPSGCGAAPPGPNLELTVPSAGALKLPAFWLGKRYGRNLLSLADHGNWYSSFYYFDCAVQEPSACRRPSILFTANMCFIRGKLAGIFGEQKPVRRQRGLPVFRFPITEYGPEVLLVTGRTVSYVIGGSGRGVDQAATEMGAMRLFGEGQAEATLPPPKFPSFDIRLMKKAKRAYESTRSVPVAARRLGISRVRLRANLKLSRSIRQFGDYGTVNCPRRGGPSTDSGSDSSASVSQTLPGY